MSTKHWFILGIFCFLLIISRSNIHAHNVDADEKVTVLLHAEPTEDPVVGEKAYINFFVSDRDKLFSFETCQCEVVLYSEGEIYLKETLKSYQLEHTFEEAGIYQVNLVGRPHNSNQFQPFEVDFNLNVVASNTSHNSLLRSKGLQIAGLGITTILVVGLIYRKLRA